LRSERKGISRWLHLLKDRNVWGIVLGRALTDPIWWFYVFWLPQYLSDARGFSLKRIALFAWVPFVAADLGNFTGGLISGYCIRRGVSVIRARTWICAVSCLPILAGIPSARVHNVYIALGLICVALVGLCELVHNGPHSAFRSFSARGRCHGYGAERVSSGTWRRRFHFCGGAYGRSIFVWAGISCSRALALAATACLFLLVRPAES
jgi:ACS family hexuronate transporter-like MFS transporter